MPTELLPSIFSAVSGSQSIGLISLALCLFYMSKKDKHIERVVAQHEKIVNKLAEALDANTEKVQIIKKTTDDTRKEVKVIGKKIDIVVDANHKIYDHMVKTVKHMKQHGLAPAE